MEVENENRLEKHIEKWRSNLLNQKSLEMNDVDELEDHLRNQIENLFKAGLDEDEAFLVAVKRLGNQEVISSEFAREYTERLWKQLIFSSNEAEIQKSNYQELLFVFLLALFSAVAIKIPSFFGINMEDSGLRGLIYAHNISLFVLPFLAFFFVWKREINTKGLVIISTSFLVAGLVINLLPFKLQGDTEILAIIHFPIILWFIVGLSYTGMEWDNHAHRMNFIRFSGEWFIYYTLIALGGGVLVMFLVFIFEAIGLNTEMVVVTWVVPCGAMGAVIISAWLVEAKKSVIENMAPVLTKIFTPLFTLLLLSFLATMIFTGKGINVEREVLIGFDLLLVLVLALLLYSISARDIQAPPTLFDTLQIVLVLSALLVDILALLAILGRISEFGFSPNKVAAFGLNIILMANLGWSAFLMIKFKMNRIPFQHIVYWQTSYLLIYAGWASIVALLFPFIFNFR